VTSPRNARVQAARKLRRRSHRDETGLFLVEGVRAVVDALSSASNVHEIFSVPERASAVEEAATRAGVPLVIVTESVLRSLTETVTPQGMVAVVTADSVPVEQMAEQADLILVLAGISDPGNAGTLVRSALACAAGGIVFTKGSVDPLNAKTVRAAAGTLFRLPVARDTPITEAIHALKAAGLIVIGADARAPTPCDRADLTRRIALVLGNEAWGLPIEESDLLDETVGIPMPGPAESLNVGIAGSILLFETVRQRRLSSPRK
jgi:RNA methyltransferase, TrmH family